MNDTSSLSHTRWNCKYHMVFAPKYRRKIFYQDKKQEIGEILRRLCEWKQVEIIKADVCPDHIHMLVSIPPKISVSGFVGFLKGKSTLIIYERHVNLKYKYGNRQFWCRGYYVDTTVSPSQWPPSMRSAAISGRWERSISCAHEDRNPCAACVSRLPETLPSCWSVPACAMWPVPSGATRSI